MPGCIVSATTASFCSIVKRRRRAIPVITSTFEKVSDIGVSLGLCLGPPADAGVRSKRGALQAVDRLVTPLVSHDSHLSWYAAPATAVQSVRAHEVGGSDGGSGTA